MDTKTLTEYLRTIENRKEELQRQIKHCQGAVEQMNGHVVALYLQVGSDSRSVELAEEALKSLITTIVIPDLERSIADIDSLYRKALDRAQLNIALNRPALTPPAPGSDMEPT
jgi:5-formyltetrahydrofolate cyclo-ligase